MDLIPPTYKLHTHVGRKKSNKIPEDRNSDRYPLSSRGLMATCNSINGMAPVLA